jgi:hypothetical protein
MFMQLLKTKYLHAVEKCLVEIMNMTLMYRKNTKGSNYHHQSSVLEMESYGIASYIWSYRLGEESWKGTRGAFTMNQQSLLRIYEKHVTPVYPFSDRQSSFMMQNFVYGKMKFRQV